MKSNNLKFGSKKYFTPGTCADSTFGPNMCDFFEGSGECDLNNRYSNNVNFQYGCISDIGKDLVPQTNYWHMDEDVRSSLTETSNAILESKIKRAQSQMSDDGESVGSVSIIKNQEEDSSPVPANSEEVGKPETHVKLDDEPIIIDELPKKTKSEQSKVGKIRQFCYYYKRIIMIIILVLIVITLAVTVFNLLKDMKKKSISLAVDTVPATTTEAIKTIQ